MAEVKKIFLGVLLLVIILGCSSQQSEEIRVGGLFGLTGFSAEWGNTDFNGALLAVEEKNEAGGINGKQIKFIVEDTQSDFKKTIVGLRKLATVDNVELIIGPTWSEFASVAIPVAEEEDIVLISSSASGITSTFSSRHFFSLWPASTFEIAKLTTFMKNKNYSQPSVIFTQNQWAEQMKSHFLEEAEKSNIKVVSVFEVAPQQGDYRTIITKLKQHDIDSVFLAFESEGEKGKFLRQAEELDFQKQVFSTASTQSQELITHFVEHSEGIIYAYPSETSRQKEFMKKYEQRFSKKPQSPNAATAYDAMHVAFKVLEKEPSNTGEITAIISKTQFQGISNYVEFNENGLIKNKEFIIKTVKNGEFVELKTN